jgi:hypothetical protein
VRKILGVAALALILLNATEGSAAESACEGGRYRVEASRFVPPLDPSWTWVVVKGDRVSVEPCGEADWSKVRRRNGRMRVRARWSSCGPGQTKLRLQMRASRGCDEATGRLRARQPRSRARFKAVRGCEIAIDCFLGSVPVDTDGDLCEDTCEACPVHDCLPGTQPVDLDSDGCTDSCGPGPFACSLDADCDDPALYCARGTGECRGPGACERTSEICTEQYAPVCGCDGRTYSNHCYAGAAGVNVATEGPCPCPEIFCEPGGEPVDSNSDGCMDRCLSACGLTRGSPGLFCTEGEHCEFPEDTCGMGDRLGLCVTTPRFCTREWAPVCGCDGTTYANDCTRRAAGVASAGAGSCAD